MVLCINCFHNCTNLCIQVACDVITISFQCFVIQISLRGTDRRLPHWFPPPQCRYSCSFVDCYLLGWAVGCCCCYACPIFFSLVYMVVYDTESVFPYHSRLLPCSPLSWDRHLSIDQQLHAIVSLRIPVIKESLRQLDSISCSNKD